MQRIFAPAVYRYSGITFYPTEIDDYYGRLKCIILYQVGCFIYAVVTALVVAVWLFPSANLHFLFIIVFVGIAIRNNYQIFARTG